MTFDQWFEREKTAVFEEDAGRGWDACKAEILSLMEERSEKCCGTKAVELDRMAQVIRTVV